MTFIDDPIQYLMEFYSTVGPVGQAELFNPGQWVPLIAGSEVDDFVYKSRGLWDYSKGREAFRSAFGDKYITLLSGVEYHEKQRQLQQDLRVELDEKKLRIDIRNSLAGAKGLLSREARVLAIKLLWRALHPCDPVPLSLIDLFESYFQDGAGLPIADSYFKTRTWKRLLGEMVHVFIKEKGGDFDLKVTPFIAGIRALSTAIEWLILARWSKWGDLNSTLRYQPPFILFPLYPSHDFELKGEKFKKGQLIFHALTVAQWLDPEAPLALFGGGVHKCPGRHLVEKLLQLVQWEFTEVEDDVELVGGPHARALESKFNGLLVPAYDWRFE